MFMTNMIAEAYAMAITLTLLLCSVFDKGIDSRSNSIMRNMLFVNFALLLCTMGTWLAEGKPEYEALDYALTFGASALPFIMAVLYTEYTIYFISIKGPFYKRFLIIIKATCAAAMALNFVSIFNNMFFSCEGGVYSMGPYFWAEGLFPAYLITPVIILILRESRSLGRKNADQLISYGIIPAVSVLIIPTPEFDSLCLAITLAILLLYVTVYANRSCMLAEKEQEMSELNVSVMLSQIQPHFLYNALGVIQDLCHDKALDAEEATVQFSEFLRGNVDSLKIRDPISFNRELDYTRNYIAIEKKRFGERLDVKYDINADDFRLPALTLQPVVENAVRNGIMRRETKTTVLITTRETDRQYIISVLNDSGGPDFTDSGARDDDTWIDSIRIRLRIMCGGDIKVRGQQGEGMVAAEITIPKRV